jgi:NADH-quinone oxidoreductase subunit L
MIVNRVADLALTVGVLAVFYAFQTVEFSTVFGLSPYLINSSILFGNVAVPPLTLITTLLFLGAMGKSAQIGLHT